MSKEAILVNHHVLYQGHEFEKAECDSAIINIVSGTCVVLALTCCEKGLLVIVVLITPLPFPAMTR